MNADELTNWKARLDREADELREQMSPLVERLRVVMEQQELVAKLLRLEVPTISKAKRPLSVPKGADVVEIVTAILEEAKEPMHISDIRLRYLDAGFSIPGAGTESNLISYITRSPAFRRVSKGTYELSKNNPQGARNG